tara:strand:- start:215 stop:454 length:240 start_codon:yes stop_codon:yes gene_type:complete
MGTVVDYTAYRLMQMVKALTNPEDAEIVLGILAEYYDGLVAIKWEAGHPVVMPLSDEAMQRGIPAGFSMVGYKAEEVEE